MAHKPDNNDDDFVDQVGEMIEYYMDLRGNPQQDCQALANAVKTQIRQHYLGERVSIRRKLENQRPPDSILQGLQGLSAREVAQRLNVSRTTAWRYMKKWSV